MHYQRTRTLPLLTLPAKVGFAKNNLEKKYMLQKHFLQFVIKIFARTIVKSLGNLTGRFSGLARNKWNLSTRKAHCSFVSILFKNVSGYGCLLLFEKLVNIAIEKGIETRGDDFIAKSSEN